MNIQQYFEGKEKKEQEKAEQEAASPKDKQQARFTVIPVIQEQATVTKEEIETGKILIQKHVTEVEKDIDIPLIQEGYDIERVPINKYIDKHPKVREDGNTIIIPVVREVLVVEKRLELVEELHVIKRKTTVDHKETVTLKKEEVDIKRTPTNNL